MDAAMLRRELNSCFSAILLTGAPDGCGPHMLHLCVLTVAYSYSLLPAFHFDDRCPQLPGVLAYLLL
jgi:hypothetical protein